MTQFTGQHVMDPKTGNLAGGYLEGNGLKVQWASDPDERTGAGPATLTAALIERLQALKQTKYWCDELEASLARANEIAAYLKRRTQDRQFRFTDGTNDP